MPLQLRNSVPGPGHGATLESDCHGRRSPGPGPAAAGLGPVVTPIKLEHQLCWVTRQGEWHIMRQCRAPGSRPRRAAARPLKRQFEHCHCQCSLTRSRTHGDQCSNTVTALGRSSYRDRRRYGHRRLSEAQAPGHWHIHGNFTGMLRLALPGSDRDRDGAGHERLEHG